jgi:hypothetical protein
MHQVSLKSSYWRQRWNHKFKANQDKVIETLSQKQNTNKRAGDGSSGFNSPYCKKKKKKKERKKKKKGS